MLKVELLSLSCRVLGQTCRTPSEFQPAGMKVVAVEEEGAFDLYHKKKHTSSFCLIIVFSPLFKDRMIV